MFVVNALFGSVSESNEDDNESEKLPGERAVLSEKGNKLVEQAEQFVKEGSALTSPTNAEEEGKHEMDGEEEKQEEDEEESEESFDTLEEEIAYLREQNRRLKAEMRLQRAKKRTIFALRRTEDDDSTMSPMQLSCEVQKRLPELIKHGLEHSDGIDSDEPRVISMQSERRMNGGSGDEESLVFTSSDGSPFVLVSQSDVIDAVAHFVAQAVLAMPETSKLSHEQLTELLDSTFDELRERGIFGRVWEWRGWFYSIYGLSTYVWTIYANPAMAKLIAQCVWTAACWIIAL